MRALRVAVIVLLAWPAAARSKGGCMLNGKRFVARYATFTDGGADDSDLTIFEIGPSDARDRRAACEDGSLADFSLLARGRVIRLVGKPAAALPDGVLVFSFRRGRSQTLHEPATRKKIQISNGKHGRKRLQLEATFAAGTCSLDIPVVVCR
jgi:hypothetical protein